MSLVDWLKNDWLLEHETSRQEIAHLLKLVDRDLRDCHNASLSVDWRFNIAYNAALQSANLALAASGFRAGREAHHHRVIRSLEYTIKLDVKRITRFDAFRKKRNASEYDRAGAISEKELGEMISFAADLKDLVVAWMHKSHPELIAD
jgi:hypothetical protein